jgi:hypothetical protein
MLAARCFHVVLQRKTKKFHLTSGFQWPGYSGAGLVLKAFSFRNEHPNICPERKALHVSVSQNAKTATFLRRKNVRRFSSQKHWT